MRMLQAELITVQAEVKTCESQEKRKKEANGSRGETRREKKNIQSYKSSKHGGNPPTPSTKKNKVLTAVVQI